jgi:hypothetical protein
MNILQDMNSIELNELRDKAKLFDKIVAVYKNNSNDISNHGKIVSEIMLVMNDAHQYGFIKD